MKKHILFFAALLCTASAWAGAGFWSSEAVKPLVLSVDGAAKNYTWNSSGVSAVALNEINSLSITSYAVQVWKDGGNICTSTMQYRVYKTSETAGDWQEIAGDWKSENGNNQVWGTKTDANKDVTPATPGEYKLEIQFISTGSENSTSDCSSTFTLNNGGNYYVLTFTIPTPSVPYVLFDNVPATVEAGTEITLSATSENFSSEEVSYAYSVKVPDATDFTPIEGTAYTPSVVGTYTLKVVATAGSESAEKEMKLTVKAAAIDITIRVQIPSGLTNWVTADPYLYLWNDDDINNVWGKLTSEGENWYSYTIHAATVNFIVVNGNAWSSDNARQTVDVKGVTASGCYVVGNASAKKSVTSTDCPTTDPTVAFESVASTATVGDVIALAATYKNFSATPTITYSVKEPGAEDFTAITDASYTVPKKVGVYVLKVVATAGEESAEKTLDVTVTTKCYLAGTGIEGLDWDEDKRMPMYDNAITLSNVAANTKISFKVVVDGSWLGFSSVDTENSSEGVEGTDNIEITTSTAGDVEIKYDASTEKIIVTGDFGGVVTITSYTVVGTKELLSTETNFDETATANDMVETAEGSKIWKLTKENVALTVQTYEYKVTANHAWGVKEYPSGNNQLEIKVAGNYDVTFTLDLTGADASLTAVAKVRIENYTIVGDKALLGSDWVVDDTANDMTEGEDVWTLTKTNVALNVGTYNYKSVANHAWSVQDFPVDNTNKEIEVKEDGYYTVTFTLTPETSLECALTKTAPAEYKFHVTYGLETVDAIWEKVTLTQVGATTEWKTEEVTLPADISEYKCYVAYNKGFGDPTFVEGKSETVTLASVGGENGATGTFSIYSDSGDNNWYLKFTKKSETPTRLVEDDNAVSVFADNGTIYTNGRDLRIYTLTGIEVTAQNGTLNGIYVVKTNGKIVKVSVH